MPGCKKENCSAGTAGGVRLLIFPQHHGRAIPGSNAYLKFNTHSAAGLPADSDLHIKGNPDEVVIRAPKLSCGDYFIYCSGLDTAAAEYVRGGIPFSIPHNASGDIDVIVPVTE